MSAAPSIARQSLAPAPSLMTVLSNAQERVDSNIEDYLGGMETSGLLVEPFTSTYRYTLLNEGAKRIRPAFVYLAGDMLGVEPNDLDRYALATEIYHTMSLVEDDLPAQDNSDKRREQPTLHVAFDVPTAGLTSSLMIDSAGRLVAETDATHGLNSELSEYAGRVLVGLAAGQLEDLATKGRSNRDMDPGELDEIASQKTGLAIEMAIVGVAIIKGMPTEVIERLKEYAKYYGIAFQIQDDIIDSLPGANGSGKTHDLDARNRKPNYVSVMGKKAAQARLALHSGMARTAIEHLSAQMDTRMFEEVIGAITDRKYHR